jgi:hypothetical protein
MSDKTTCLSPRNLKRYLGKIQRYANSEKAENAGYERRLKKVARIVYFPEEMDAISAKE